MKGTEIPQADKEGSGSVTREHSNFTGLQVGGLMRRVGGVHLAITRLGGWGRAQPLKSSNEPSQGLHQGSSNEPSQGLHQGSRGDILCHIPPTKYK